MAAGHWMMRYIPILATVSTFLHLSACDGVENYNGHGTDGSISGNYFAVVGYYNQGVKEYKEVGVSKLPACRERALGEYRRLNAEQQNRAFDWFCKNTHSGRIDR